MDNISRAELFIQVVNEKSFVGAARKLGITGPAISKQVQALEKELGVRLLHRTTRQVTLTEEGAIYAERARKALEDLKEAKDIIQDSKINPQGSLKISAPTSFGHQYLTHPIIAFAKKYPDIKLHINFDDHNVDIIGENYDIAIRVGALKDSSLIARKLANCPIILCASPKFIKKHGPIKSPESLINYPAIIYNKQANLAEWQAITPKNQIETYPLSRHLTANNAEIMLEACLQGLCLTLLPIFSAAPHLQSGKLIQILPKYKTYPERGIYATFPQKQYLSTRTRLFIDWLTNTCKHLPW